MKPHVLKFYYCTHEEYFDTHEEVRKRIEERRYMERKPLYTELHSYNEHVWTQRNHQPIEMTGPGAPPTLE